MNKLFTVLTAASIFAGCQTFANVETSPRPKLRPENFNVTVSSVYQNTRSEYDIDYSIEWDFNYQNYTFLENHEVYRKLALDKHGVADFEEWPWQGEYQFDQCHDFLSDEIVDQWRNGQTARGGLINRCIGNLSNTMYVQFLSEDNTMAKIFFEEYLPMWIDNDAFVMKNYWEGDYHNIDAVNEKSRYAIFRLYYTYAPYYGYNTPTMDKNVFDWWERTEKTSAQNLYGKKLDVCSPPSPTLDIGNIYPARTKMMSWGACNNEAAAYAYHLVLTGLYFKSNDHINEAIWVAQNIVNHATPEGATRDAMRGGKAYDYLLSTAVSLDALVYELNYNFNYDLYSYKGKNGVTMADVIEYGALTWIDSTHNSKYDWIDPSRGHATPVGTGNNGDGEAELYQRAGCIQQMPGNLFWKNNRNQVIDDYREMEVTMLCHTGFPYRYSVVREAREKN